MSSRDLEKEMSKFEAELSKLTSSTFSAPANPPKPKISIQMPTSFTSQFVQQQQQLQQQQQQQASSAPLPSHAPPLPPQPPAFNPPSIQRQTLQQQTPGSGVKRDSSGKPIAGATHQLGQHQHPRPSGEASYNEEQKAAKKPGFSGAAGAGGGVGGSGGGKPQNPNKNKSKKLLRSAGGEVWEDTTLNEWDPDDFRLFCGDLGNEVSDEALARAFQKYPSMVKAKVIRDKRTGKTRGYGFVSFKSSEDFIKAMREMNGKYVGNRPIKLRKSTWRDRNLEMVKKKETEKQKTGFR